MTLEAGSYSGAAAADHVETGQRPRRQPHTPSTLCPRYGSDQSTEMLRAASVRKSDRPVSRDGTGHAAQRVPGISVGMHTRPAALYCRDDLLHGDHRRVRGAAVQHAGAYRGLADPRRARPSVDGRARHLAAARGGFVRQPIGGRAANVPQAPDSGRQLSDAAAVEFSPADARAEHELLPGRVRGPGGGEGDANRTGRARHLDDRGRYPGLRGHLFRDHDGGRRQSGSLARAAVRGLAGVVPRGPCPTSCRGSAGSRRSRPMRAR